MAKQSTKAAAPASKTASSTGKKAGGGLATPVQPSPELAVIVGKDALPRAEIVKKMWDYIKKHDLQNPKNKREILADDKLKPIFGKDKATMFEMNAHIAKHVK